MAEATSSLTFTQLQLQVAEYLGLTASSGNWSADETARIARIIARGLRQFYAAHNWSGFMEIRTTLATVAADFDYALPDLFGDVIHGDMTFATTDPVGPNVFQDSAENIRRLLATGQGYSGRPQRFGIEATSLGGASGLRKQVIFWPVPDAVYTLGYTYRVNQNDISGSNYPVGGAQQAECILASCLAVAELNEHDEKGAYHQDYREKLADAIMTERRAQAGFVMRPAGEYDWFERQTTITGM